MTTKHQQNLKAQAKSTITIAALLAGGTLLHLFMIFQMAQLPRTKSNVAIGNWVKIGVGVLAITGCAAAAGMLPENRRLREGNRYARQALAYNQGAEINLLTQPIRKTLSQSEMESEMMASTTLELFDWGKIRNADDHPTIAVFAPMGGGKSVVMQWLARHVIGADTGYVFDTQCNEWAPGLTVLTEVDDIANRFREDLQLVDKLRRLTIQEKRQLSQQVRILDEAPDTIAEICSVSDQNNKLYRDWIRKMSTYVRKLKIRTILGSVVLAADDLGVSASKRNSMTIVFPGVKGVALAMQDTAVYKLGGKENKALRDQLTRSLTGIDRPALVLSNGQWHPAAIPELDDYGNPIEFTHQPEEFNDGLDHIREKLAALEMSKPPNQISDRARLQATYEQKVEPDWLPTIRQMKAREGEEKFNLLAQAILNASYRSGLIKARNIHKNLTQFKCYSADEIRQVFLMLEYHDRGRAVGDGVEMGFQAFLPDTDSTDSTDR